MGSKDVLQRDALHSKKKVVVLGAGISGLTVAWQLGCPCESDLFIPFQWNIGCRGDTVAVATKRRPFLARYDR